MYYSPIGIPKITPIIKKIIISMAINKRIHKGKRSNHITNLVFIFVKNLVFCKNNHNKKTKEAPIIFANTNENILIL